MVVFYISCLRCCTKCVSLCCSSVSFQVTVPKAVIVSRQQVGKYSNIGWHTLDLMDSVFFSSSSFWLNVIILHLLSFLSGSAFLTDPLNFDSNRKSVSSFFPSRHEQQFKQAWRYLEKTVCIPVQFQLWTVWNGVFAQQLILQSLSPSSPH